MRFMLYNNQTKNHMQQSKNGENKCKSGYTQTLTVRYNPYEPL